jgi:hypothetical protein
MISPNKYYESLSDAKLLWVNTYISGNLYCFRISPDFQTVKFVQPNKTHIREYFLREDLSYALSEMRVYRDSIKEYCPIEYYNQFIDYLDRVLKLKGICYNNMAYVGRLDLDQYTYVNDLVKFDNIELEVAPTVEPVIVIQSPPIIEPVISFVDRWD